MCESHWSKSETLQRRPVKLWNKLSPHSHNINQRLILQPEECITDTSTPAASVRRGCDSAAVKKPDMWPESVVIANWGSSLLWMITRLVRNNSYESTASNWTYWNINEAWKHNQKAFMCLLMPNCKIYYLCGYILYSYLKVVKEWFPTRGTSTPKSTFVIVGKKTEYGCEVVILKADWYHWLPELFYFPFTSSWFDLIHSLVEISELICWRYFSYNAHYAQLSGKL